MKEELVVIAITFCVYLISCEPVWAKKIDCDKFRQSSVDCLACNMYQEARGEGKEGMKAVGLVTYNRFKSRMFPGNVCKVVWQAKRHYKTKRLVPQFSWTQDGNSDKVHSQKLWKTARELAIKILVDKVPDLTNGALFFHAKRVAPKWSRKMKRTAVIGNHLFYTTP